MTPEEEEEADGTAEPPAAARAELDSDVILAAMAAAAATAADGATGAAGAASVLIGVDGLEVEDSAAEGAELAEEARYALSAKRVNSLLMFECPLVECLNMHNV